jgi:CTP synthase
LDLKKKNTKYIFVTGGVLSGLGKGISAASIGAVLKSRGLSVNAQKLDPYLNVDAGTLNPAEHGECYVTKDGAETDLDLGHYERFLDVEMTQKSSVMSGRILLRLIEDERAGKYLGKTVQVVPHLTGTIQDVIAEAGSGYDIHIVEIGGTVGDAESPAFFEAIREFADRVGRENCLYVQVVYLPFLGTSKETKTKPAQNAVRELRSLGISPDILVARSEHMPVDGTREKLARLTGVAEQGISILPNAPTVYQVPLTIKESGLDEFIVDKLGLKSKRPNLKSWRQLVEQATKPQKKSVTVGVVAKYMDNEDTYISVFEALKAAAWKHDIGLEIKWIEAEDLEKGQPASKLKGIDGMVVPGGFGSRGVEGKIKAAQHALKKKVPYLGLCLGMQVGVIALARNNGMPGANTTEIDKEAADPVIDIMEGQENSRGTGGTMRLGNYTCVLNKKSQAAKLYGERSIEERHRHRFEFNNKYRDTLESKGLIIAGESPDGQLVELIEIKDHPFFMASQYHPELKSRPMSPHPMFDGFIAQLKSSKG